MALSLCIRKRAPVRSQVTKIHKEIISNLESESKNYSKATVGVRRILDVQKVLLSSDKEIIDILAEDDEADLEKEMDDCAHYQEIIIEAIVAYEDAQKQVAREVVVQDSLPDTTEKIRLPTMELPKFSGNLIDWLTFWAQFEKIHLDIRLKDSDKFYYLLQSLSVDTEAYKIVSIYPLTEENYSKAIDALRRRYANPDLLLQVYVRELLKLVIESSLREWSDEENSMLVMSMKNEIEGVEKEDSETAVDSYVGVKEAESKDYKAKDSEAKPKGDGVKDSETAIKGYESVNNSEEKTKTNKVEDPEVADQVRYFETIEAKAKDEKIADSETKVIKKVLLSSDKEIIDILAEDDEADLEKEMDDCAHYQEIIIEAIVAYEDAQKQVAREVVVQDSLPDTTEKIRLPTMELPKFSGNLIDWLTFWAQFEKIHLDIRLKDSDKFYYLLQSLSVDTEAYKIVSIYPLTEENYSKAIDALRRRYANPDLLLQVYVRELLKLVIESSLREWSDEENSMLVMSMKNEIEGVEKEDSETAVDSYVGVKEAESKDYKAKDSEAKPKGDGVKDSETAIKGYESVNNSEEKTKTNKVEDPEVADQVRYFETIEAKAKDEKIADSETKVIKKSELYAF
ncbi:hypothetical protein LAZ67_11000348 [Cordylochernes scorpioides]|uniref:Uncharacterized protein n=1 Tax=Cordylochernes scorpioides TaxID=51811 RepID=A0ABY6KXS9_9ARAC|nr:hypothetical protein LAZ67_11000348 [Cordylochernes scorpioides]